jgi:hypothetical protein
MISRLHSMTYSFNRFHNSILAEQQRGERHGPVIPSAFPSIRASAFGTPENLVSPCKLAKRVPRSLDRFPYPDSKLGFEFSYDTILPGM